MPSMTVAEKQTREFLLNQGHNESEIVRRYGASPSLYLMSGGQVVRAYEPKLIFGSNEVFLTPNELEQLRACPYPTELIIFRKNSPPKPQMSIPISALNELGAKTMIKHADMEVILLPEQMLVRDKKTIKALTVVPKYVMDNLRFIYELGDAKRQTKFLRLLDGALKEIMEETMTPETYRHDIEQRLEDNRRKIGERKEKEGEGN